ncbi:MAG: hypothetical protein K0Q95_716 [Bacteroidota bacterium]|jgi:hypothetical protein|nr:hypothetical protein [Bacteroidota bacterium]
MKKLITITIVIGALSLFSEKGFSQDTLIMKNGNHISSKIMEVSPEEIRYKRFDNLDGPIFVVKSNEVDMIKYKNGTSDSIRSASPKVIATVVPDLFPPIHRRGMFFKQGNITFKQREMHSLVSKTKDPVILAYTAKAKTAKNVEYVGFVAIPAFVFTLGWTGYALLNNSFAYSDISYAPAIASAVIAAAALTTSITFKLKGRNYDDAAIRAYNEKY